MNCSPCGSGSNYTSISTTNCVTLCGAGISTFITNPVFSLSSINANFLLPSTISTFIVNPSFIVNIPSTISTYITNPYVTVNIPSTISTYITNPSIVVNIPSTISTYVTNPCFTLCGAGISTNLTNSTLTVNVNSNIYSAFSRLITETPYTYMTSHVSFTPQYEIIGYMSTGAGNVFVDLSNTIVQLSTTGSGASRAFRQSLEYQVYQPGKSHQAIMTWTPQFKGTFDTSVAVRCGIYDDYRDKNTPVGPMGAGTPAFISSIYGGLGQETNQPSMGHYFELSGNNWFVVELANSPNNILNVTRVAQSNWNVDTLNPAFGNNPSGVTLQRTTETLFWIERQWLGVGAVNMGIYYNTHRIICHQFLNRGIKIPYTALNKLPLRTEIEKVTGGSSDAVATGSMCWSSQIDGQYIPMGTLFSLPANLVQPTTRIDSNRLYPVLLLRLQQQYCRATFKIKTIELYGKAAGVYSIFKNPRITNSITWVNHPDSRSMIQYAKFANGTTEPTNVLSGGQCIYSGFYDKRTTFTGGASAEDIITETQFSSDIKGAPDIICFAMSGFSDNDDVNANLRWIEIV